VLSRTAADISLLQETKLRNYRLATAKKQAEKLGWRAHFGPALVTQQMGTSGGTAVMSRKGLGSKPHDTTLARHANRICGAWIGAVVKGGVHCFSVYLKDSEGISDTNADVLTHLTALIAAVRGPWIIGGDWNVSPDTLRKSNWPSIVGGHIHAPLAPTCYNSTYDYFVVSKDINPAVAGVCRLSDGGCVPH
jgi:exonuclease III